MATFSSDIYAATQSTNNTHGVARSSAHMHAICAVPSTLATADILNMGYLPANAIVVAVTLKAQSQIDSSTGLTLSVGTVATPTLWMNALTTVGRASGVTSSVTMATASGLTKTTAKTLIIVTATAGPTTGVAGNIELNIEYYVEEPAGSQA